MAPRLNRHLSKKRIEELRKKLENDANRITTNFEEKRKEYSESLNQNNKDSVDTANDDILLATNMRFTKREANYLKKIKMALSKFNSDEYGLCEDCGEQISYERLRARPTSELCIECKEESEKFEMNTIHAKKSSSVGQMVRL